MTEFTNNSDLSSNDDSRKAKLVQNDLGNSTQKFHEIEKSHLGNSLLSRLFPSEVAKELAGHQLQATKTEVIFRERMLGVLRETEAQTLTELANDGLENFKALLRANRGEFFHSMHVEFENKLSLIDDVFEENCMRLEVKIKQCTNELMKQMRVESFKETIENHFKVKGRLIQRFNDILEERIDTLSGKTKGSL